MSKTFTKRHVFIEFIEELMARVIIPRQTAMMYTCGLLAEMIILLRGGTGTGKSTLAKHTSDFFGASCEYDADRFGNIRIAGGNSNRVQCTFGTQSRAFLGGPDIGKMATGITEVVFRKFITKPIRLFDEAGRLNPYVWADLAQLLAEYELDIEGETLRLPRKGTFIFTMNPPNPMDPANNELPPFILSRVNMKLALASPTVSANRKIARKDTTRVPMPKKYTQKDLEAAQDEFRAGVKLSLPADVALSTMVRATSYCKMGGEFCDKNEVIEAGMFPTCCANAGEKGPCDYAKVLPCTETNPLDARTLEAAGDLACALAYLDNRTEATVEDVVAAFSVVCEHKLNFYNTQFTSKAAHTKGFVTRLLASSQDCINLAKKSLQGKVSTKDIEGLKKGKNPLVTEIISDFEEEIANAAKKVRSSLAGMNSRQLREAKGHLADAEAALVDKMVTARLKVEVAVKDAALADQPAFRDVFRSPEDQPFIESEAGWETLLSEGFFDPHETMANLTIEYFSGANNVLILHFTDAVEADAFREKFAERIGAMKASIIDPYRDIRAELEAASILPPAPKAERPATTDMKQAAFFD